MARSAILPALTRAAAALRSKGAATPLSRREFGRVAGLGAVASFVAACGSDSRPPVPSRSERVVIVGAGIAGLHAAYRFAQLGVRAAVFDAADHVGGRIHTDRTTFGPSQTAELGAEFIDSVHTTMRGLAAELGLVVDDLEADDDGTPTFFLGGRPIGLDELAKGFLPLVNAIDAALATLTDPSAEISHRNPNGAAPLDALSVRDWLDSVHAEGPIRGLLEAGLVAEYGLEPEEQSALNLVLAFAPGEVSDQRYRIRGGNDQVPSRLAERLDAGQLELGQRLVALRERSDGRYVITFERDQASSELLADHVVLAIPFTLLREVDLRVSLPDVKRRAIAELGYGTNAKLVSGFESRAWRAAGSNGTAVTDSPAAVIWEATRGQSGARGVLTSFRGGSRGVALGAGSAEDQLAAFLPVAEQIFPGVAAQATGQVVRFHWPSYAFTKGSYAAYRVGQYTTIAGAEFERVGNLHFCGEHTSRAFQGYMEGGAETGATVAQEVAADLGVAPPVSPLNRSRAGQARGASRTRLSVC